MSIFIHIRTSHRQSRIAKKHPAFFLFACRKMELTGSRHTGQFRNVMFVHSAARHDDNAVARLLHQFSQQRCPFHGRRHLARSQHTVHPHAYQFFKCLTGDLT